MWTIVSNGGKGRVSFEARFRVEKKPLFVAEHLVANPASAITISTVYGQPHFAQGYTHVLGGVSAIPCAFPPPRPSIFSDYSFLVYHPVNRDDRHLLAHAMASGFTVAWYYSQREQLVLLLQIKLYAHGSIHTVSVFINFHRNVFKGSNPTMTPLTAT
jgi:hypothetical protein